MFTRRELISAASAAALGSAARAARAATPTKSKRDLMMEVLNMQAKPGYVPAGFFMHFGVKGDAALRAHLDHFRGTGMDFLKIQLDEQSLRFDDPVRRPEDWGRIPVLPEKWWDPSLSLLKGLVREAKPEGLIIQTLFSPFQMAKQAVPSKTIIEHARQDPEAVCRGMENIALSILHFMHACARLGADGFYMCTQGGETNRFADRALFNRVVKNYDMLLYKEASQLTACNITHICDYDGAYQDFAPRFQDYPGHVINVPLEADGKPLSTRAASEMFRRPVMGGLNRLGVIANGTAAQVKEAALAVLKDAPANFVLGADCTVSAKTPRENLKIAIDTAHAYRA